MPDQTGEDTKPRGMNAIDYDQVIAAPLIAAVNAQTQASHQFANFLDKVCLDQNGAVKNVKFQTQQDAYDKHGRIVDTVNKSIDVPLMSIITLPTINIESFTSEFSIDISDSVSSETRIDINADTKGKMGWKPFDVSMDAKVGAHIGNRRETDTRAMQKVVLHATRSEAPEGLMKVLDFLNNSLTPSTSSGKSDDDIPDSGSDNNQKNKDNENGDKQ